MVSDTVLLVAAVARLPSLFKLPVAKAIVVKEQLVLQKDILKKLTCLCGVSDSVAGDYWKNNKN